MAMIYLLTPMRHPNQDDLMKVTILQVQICKHKFIKYTKTSKVIPNISIIPISNLTGTIQTTIYSKSLHHTTVKPLIMYDTKIISTIQLVQIMSQPTQAVRSLHHLLSIKHSIK